MTEALPEASARQGTRGRWWEQPLAWSVLLSVAFIAYELTAEPVLGVVLVCSKFGWQDCLIAYRLWRVDPNRSRRRTMSWMYVAYGLTKIAIAAGIILLGAVSICARNVVLGQQLGQGLVGRVASACVTCVLVLLLGVVATGLGFWCANRFSVKVWLGTYYVRQISASPWQLRLHHYTNGARGLLELYMQPTWLVAPGYIIAMLPLVNPQMPISTIVGLMLVLALIAAPVIVICYRAERRKLIATNPVECWGTDLVGAIMCMSVGTAEKSRWLAAIPPDSWRTDELASTYLRPLNVTGSGEAQIPAS
jgi:hypothetical protein